MQMGDYRLDHLVVLTCMEKKWDYWNRKIGAFFAKIMHGFAKF
jgi:hypothetical protein